MAFCVIIRLMKRIIACLLAFSILGFSVFAQSKASASVAFSGFGGGLPSSAVTVDKLADDEEFVYEEDTGQNTKKRSGLRTAAWITVGVVATAAATAMIVYGAKKGTDNCIEGCVDDMCSSTCDGLSDSFSQSCSDSLAESCNSEKTVQIVAANVIPVYMP